VDAEVREKARLLVEEAKEAAKIVVEEAKEAARELAKEKAELANRISDLEMKLITLTTEVKPLSAAMLAVFTKELTHFHTPEMDALLVKFEDGAITDAGEERLLWLLEERSRELNGSIPESERDVATMFPMMMKRVKVERRLAAVELLVVSTSVPHEGSK
jgi:hypothetical protein